MDSLGYSYVKIINDKGSWKDFYRNNDNIYVVKEGMKNGLQRNKNRTEFNDSICWREPSKK